MKKSWPTSPMLLTERFCALRAESANLLTTGALAFLSCISAAINSIVSKLSVSFTARPVQALSLCKSRVFLLSSMERTLLIKTQRSESLYGGNSNEEASNCHNIIGRLGSD